MRGEERLEDVRSGVSFCMKVRMLRAYNAFFAEHCLRPGTQGPGGKQGGLFHQQKKERSADKHHCIT